MVEMVAGSGSEIYFHMIEPLATDVVICTK